LKKKERDLILHEKREGEFFGIRKKGKGRGESYSETDIEYHIKIFFLTFLYIQYNILTKPLAFS
jgi:hypothetical protein